MKQLFILLSLLFFQVFVHAGDTRYRIDTAYHHDEAPTQSIEAAQSLAFKPYSGDLRLGFAKGETWIRLRIQADALSDGAVPTMAAAPLVLRVGPYYLDDVVFYAQQKGHWFVQQGGDRQLLDWGWGIISGSFKRLLREIRPQAVQMRLGHLPLRLW